jgi:hypothetical protein
MLHEQVGGGSLKESGTHVRQAGEVLHDSHGLAHLGQTPLKLSS